MEQAFPTQSLEQSTSKQKKVIQKKTRRGISRKNKNRKNENKTKNKFSLLGANANGLKAKVDSLKNLIHIFDKPSCITIQETKLRTSRSVQLPGYQIFQIIRSGLGGGILTAVIDDLSPVLIDSDEENEILIVQVKVDDKQIRIFNAYGPQENTESLNFWTKLEQGIIKAKDENCFILIEMDANAKLEYQIQNLSSNGKLLQGFVSRQNLTILNNLDICKGHVTRQRTTKNNVEKAVIDYIICCDKLADYVDTVLVDDERLFTLTKYVTTRGKKEKIMSDHNTLFSNFDLSFSYEVNHSSRKQIFNFKNKEAQEAFAVETEQTNKFTDIFEKDDTFENQAKQFNRCLKQTIQKCFKKCRIRKKPKETDVDRLLKNKSKLKIFMQTCKDEKLFQQSNTKLECLEMKIQKLSSMRNVKIVEDFVKTLDKNGKFSQSGMWKLRKKLHPSKTIDPPMAKVDTKGNLVTAPNLIRKLYLDTYKNRLSHRQMKSEFLDVFYMKTDLWRRRQKALISNKSPDWTLKDLNKVLKSLKNNKSRDPHGFLNDIFKPGMAGQNLKMGILHLVNGVKKNFCFPQFLQWANITTIYKSKGSRLSLESDRGIFVISVLKRIMDKLIYNDMYDYIDRNMSDSNIGGRRDKNIRNHLFIIHGIINAVVKGDTEPIDIQIYDIEKAFDALWLDECMNDLYDTVPATQQDDKLALRATRTTWWPSTRPWE